MQLEILYQDEDIIAINKPPGLLVHRTGIAADATEFAVQQLRNQIDRHVYPIHRLDRKTSGVLLFALNEDVHRVMQRQFAERKVQKRYLAIVRGHTKDKDEIDYALKKENGQMQEAITQYATLERTELPIPFGKHNTSRYSLLEVKPLTGRKHQIRRHMAHIHHPIIADRPHGCNKQNKLFLHRFGLMTMMLHALAITVFHPFTEENITIQADLHMEFKRMMRELGFNYLIDQASL